MKLASNEHPAIVIKALQSLAHEGSWCGETHIQKMLYLCQEITSVGPIFKYILYKHGPFSFDLSAQIQSLIADGLVSVLPRPPYGPSLVVTNEGAKFVERSGEEEQHGPELAAMAKRIGTKRVADLEKLATAIFVNRRSDATASSEERAKALNELKPHIPIEAAKLAVADAEALERETKHAGQ